MAAPRPADHTLVPALVRLASEGTAAAEAGIAAPVVLADRPDGTVVRVGGVVAKAHAQGSDLRELGVRLAVAAHPLLHGILLAPCGGPKPGTVDGRAVTLWPYGEPVDRSAPQTAPWEAAGTLLARLHAVPLRPAEGAMSPPGQGHWRLAAPPDEPPGDAPAAEPPSRRSATASPPGRAQLPPGGDAPLPPMRGPLKAAAAVARLDGVPGSAAERTVRRAWERLPEAGGSGAVALCHGDLHLGQLVRHPAPDGAWVLIDIDDLGAGDPAWDLARPAMWCAAGLLEPDAWARFLAAYRAAGGVAVPADGDPWPYLDLPARALAVQTAATAVVKAHRESRGLDAAESQLLTACGRIAQLKANSPHITRS